MPKLENRVTFAVVACSSNVKSVLNPANVWKQKVTLDREKLDHSYEVNEEQEE